MITTILIATNILVFIAMALSGASIFEPTIQSIIDWGGISSDLIIGGQWWRLFSSMFVHIGLFHLGMNMYVLYSIGSFLEEFLGKTLFMTSYLATGVLSGLCSFIVNQHSFTVSAGASGAIAGIFGVYIFILLTPLIAKQIRTQLLKNVGYALAINLFYGLNRAGTIDHAAHLGGLVSGLGIGAIFYPFLSRHLWVHKTKFLIQEVWLKRVGVGSIIGITLLLVPAVIVGKKPSDHLQFSSSLKEFSVMKEEIDTALNNIDMSNYTLMIELELSKIAPKVDALRELAMKVASYKLNQETVKIQRYFCQYCDLYVQRFHFFFLAIKQSTDRYDSEIERLDREMEELNHSYYNAT